MESKDSYLFRKEIEKISKLRGRHTELVTVYIPAGYEITKTIGRLADEQGTATNIKSKTVRKNVSAALERIIQHLKLFKRTPEHGIAVFCGNISQKEGVADIELFPVIPPEPLKIGLYRCSQEFVVDPLKDMAEKKNVYGLLILDRREANVAFLRGKRVEPIKHISSMVPGKFRAGGQSAARFSRVIEGLAGDWYKEIAELATKVFSEEELKGIIVGGPGPSKNDFVDGDFLPTDIKKQILGIMDLGYTGEFGLEELVEKSEGILADAEVTKEKQMVNRFLEGVARDGLVTYGKAQVTEALKAKAVKTLMLSENLDSDEAEKFVEMCRDSGAEVEFISVDTHEGEQIWRLGGYAAFLRYKLDY